MVHCPHVTTRVRSDKEETAVPHQRKPGDTTLSIDIPRPLRDRFRAACNRTHHGKMARATTALVTAYTIAVERGDKAFLRRLEELA